MKIKYISWYYGRGRDTDFHLIRLEDGRGLIRTSEQMVALGLATY